MYKIERKIKEKLNKCLHFLFVKFSKQKYNSKHELIIFGI